MTASPIMELPANLKESPESYSDRISIRLTQKIELLSAHEIEWIEADGNYVSIHARGRSYVQRATMIEFERRLNPTMFMRVHRSRIVNVTKIKEVLPLFHGEFELVLLDGTRFTTGRKYSQQVASLRKAAA